MIDPSQWTATLKYSVPLTCGAALLPLALLLRHGPTTLLAALCFFLAVIGYMSINHTSDIMLFTLYASILLILSAHFLVKKDYWQSRWLYFPGIIGLIVWLYTSLPSPLCLPYETKICAIPVKASIVLWLTIGLNALLTLYLWAKQKNTWLTHYFFSSLSFTQLIGLMTVIAYLSHKPDSILALTYIGVWVSYFSWTLWGMIHATVHEQKITPYLYAALISLGALKLFYKIAPNITFGSRLILCGGLFTLIGFYLTKRKKNIGNKHANPKTQEATDGTNNA